MEDFEPMPPRDNEALRKAMFKEMESEYGIKKLMDEEWKEFLLFGQTQSLSLDEIVERYGSVLTEQQLTNIKALINKDNG